MNFVIETLYVSVDVIIHYYKSKIKIEIFFSRTNRPRWECIYQLIVGTKKVWCLLLIQKHYNYSIRLLIVSFRNFFSYYYYNIKLLREATVENIENEEISPLSTTPATDDQYMQIMLPKNGDKSFDTVMKDKDASYFDDSFYDLSNFIDLDEQA